MAIDAFGNFVPDTAPGQGALPAPLGTSSGASRIDPALSPYLQMGLQRAQQLFFGAQPQMFQGQTYVSPSAQTEQALAQQEALATGAQPTLQAAQQAYQSSLGQIGQTAARLLSGARSTHPLMRQLKAPVVKPTKQRVGCGSSLPKSLRTLGLQQS